MAAPTDVALCRCDALPLQYISAPLNSITYWCNIVAKSRWHKAMAISGSPQAAFSDTKSIPHLAPCSWQQLLEEKRIPSLFILLTPPSRSEKVPLCNWQWVKFGQSNCRSCCWPWAALNTFCSGAWMFPGPMLLEVHLFFWPSSSSAFRNELFAFGILWARRI